MTCRKTLIVSAVAVFLAACGGPTSDLGTDQQGSHSWGGYHWARTSNPFTVKLGDSVTSAWDSYLNSAASDWNSSTVLNTQVIAGNGTSARKCTPTAGRVEVCNTTYGQNGWLGIASIWLSNGHISQGSVKLNDTYYAMAQYNTPAWRQMVVCQEVGHTFGLDHQDTDFNNANLNTCMDYTNNPGTNQHPNAHDYDELVTIYSHNDSFTSTASAPPQTSALDVGQDLGRQVSDAVFVREIDPENAVITHVFWAPDSNRNQH